jgi:hypothetical protein
MVDLKGQWQSLGDRAGWEVRAGALKAKLVATKEIWFPSTPTRAAKTVNGRAKKATKKTTQRSTSAARKATKAAAKKST